MFCRDRNRIRLTIERLKQLIVANLRDTALCQFLVVAKDFD
jgi:hypothetical protein